jgi:nucleoside-diphosphate-sugar epimerase
MATGKVQLVNGGKGICNCIYIDDLVDMMIKAAKQPNIDGETFIASNPTPLTWKQFYGYFEEIIGQKRTVEQLKAAKSFNSNWVKPDFKSRTLNLRHKITPLLPRNFKDWVKAELRKWQNTEKPIPLTQEQERYFASTAKFDVRKAVDKLGFVQSFNYRNGFKQLAHWYHNFFYLIIGIE